MLRKQLEQFLENVFGFFFVLLSYVNIGLIKKKQKKQQLIKQFYLFKKAKDVFCKVKGWFDCSGAGRLQFHNLVNSSQTQLITRFRLINN